MTEYELRELEQVEKVNGMNVKHFKGNSEKVMENRFDKFVKKYDIDISLLIVRKHQNRYKYSLYYHGGKI